MIQKLRKIALGTVAIAAVIVLFATGPEVAQVWFQAANAQLNPIERSSPKQSIEYEIAINNRHPANHPSWGAYESFPKLI
jgi:hypothetical protein